MKIELLEKNDTYDIVLLNGVKYFFMPCLRLSVQAERPLAFVLNFPKVLRGACRIKPETLEQGEKLKDFIIGRANDGMLYTYMHGFFHYPTWHRYLLGGGSLPPLQYFFLYAQRSAATQYVFIDGDRMKTFEWNSNWKAVEEWIRISSRGTIIHKGGVEALVSPRFNVEFEQGPYGTNTRLKLGPKKPANVHHQGGVTDEIAKAVAENKQLMLITFERTTAISAYRNINAYATNDYGNSAIAVVEKVDKSSIGTIYRIEKLFEPRIDQEGHFHISRAKERYTTMINARFQVAFDECKFGKYASREQESSLHEYIRQLEMVAPLSALFD